MFQSSADDDDDCALCRLSSLSAEAVTISLALPAPRQISFSAPENHAARRIELPAGGSFNLAMVEQTPTFESLGPVRVAYKLSSTDPTLKQLLPAGSAFCTRA